MPLFYGMSGQWNAKKAMDCGIVDLHLEYIDAMASQKAMSCQIAL